MNVSLSGTFPYFLPIVLTKGTVHLRAHFSDAARETRSFPPPPPPDSPLPSQHPASQGRNGAVIPPQSPPPTLSLTQVLGPLGVQVPPAP